jgi:hypothetical protein
MIIVIIGGSAAHRSEIVRQLMSAEGGLVCHLSIEGVAGKKDAGLFRLRNEFESARNNYRVITVISGVVTVAELNYLRTKKAFVCHVYGVLAKLHADIKIRARDVFVMPDPPIKNAPPHLYTPSEVLSECRIRG